MSDKPMPCPFCGSERIHLVHFDHWYARCTDCYALNLSVANPAVGNAGQDTKRLDWYLHRSRVRGWDHDRTSIQTGSDYLSGMRKWIDECLGYEEPKRS